MEAQIAQTYSCSLCKGKFSFENVKYSNDGKRLICVPCYNEVMRNTGKKAPVLADGRIVQPIRFKSSVMQQPTPLPAPASMVKLVCLDCNYRFAYKKYSEANLRCPYCARTHLTYDDANAQNLIAEASRGVGGY